jgi:NAD dependent epimerase/dehydratase family enzyme
MNMQKLGESFLKLKLKTLKTALRTSIVLGKMAALCSINLAKFGLGGKQGKGNQFISWIHEKIL